MCEGTCILNETAEPVSIRAIEQFLNEYAFARGVVEAVMPPTGMRVAVVGSGPGGLACADVLSRRGYAVTILDSALLPGGLLLNGIPAFTLERTVVQRRIELLQQRGVVFQMGVKPGEDIGLKQLQSDYDAVFLGMDAQQARSLDVPGAGLPGVIQALPFTIMKNTNLPLNIPPVDVSGKRVVVLGGGDTAMDCLRTALRCGAGTAVCVYRRDEANMPCSREAFEDAREEGARFIFQSAPVAVVDNGQGRASGLRLIHTALGEKDAGGRRSFVPQLGTEFDLAADWILLALGFERVPFPPGSDFRVLATDEQGGLVVDENQMTSVPGVFAGGDLVRGPSNVLDVVRDARKAAEAIHRRLSARKPARTP
jgi:glutamate synthase (NADPH/NADH) small chain